MMLPSTRRSPAWLLVSLIWFGAAFAQVGCDLEDLPSSLSSIGLLNFNNELHIQGKYYANFSLFRESISFTLTTPTASRFYIAPHDVDADMYLRNSTSGQTIMYSSWFVDTEEVLTGRLLPGSYELVFYYWDRSQYADMICPYLELEIALVPVDRAVSRLGTYTCPPTSSFPTPNLANIPVSGFNYYSGATVYSIAPSTATSGLALYNKYPFTVAPGNLWVLKAALGRDFLTSGSVGLLLRAASDTAPTDLSCVDDGSCLVGTNTELNSNLLDTTLISGSYELWIYEDLDWKDTQSFPSHCYPVTLALNIKPTAQKEDPTNCAVGRVPETLNAPGLLDFDVNSIHYQKTVLMDLTAGSHKITFTLAETSVFRILVEEHARVDIDLMLYQSDNTPLESTLKARGAEAIWRTLPAGSYYALIDFWGTYEIIFCETMDLRIEIRPLSEVPNFCASYTPQLPSLSDLPAALARNSPSYSFTGNAAYRQDFNGDFRQKNIYSIAFNVSMTRIFRANVWSDFALGAVDLTLSTTDITKPGNPVLTTFYSSTLGSRRFLDLVIEPGQNYVFTVRTGIVQSVGLQASDLAGLPACYLFNLRVNIFGSLSERTCNGATLLASTFQYPGLLLTNDEIHLSNTFALNGRTDTFFSPRVDSFLRVFSDSPTNVVFRLYSSASGTALVSSTSGQNSHSLLYQLSAGGNYTLRVVPDASTPRCSEIDLQFALDRKPAAISNPCTAPKSLPTNLIPRITSAWSSLDAYAFDQTATAYKVQIPVTVNATLVSFRAFVHDSFLWDDITLMVRDSTGAPLILSKMIYNGRDILPVYLEAGDYILEVAETQPMWGFTYGCITFTLGVYIEPADLAPVDSFSCKARPLASTFNTPQFLFPASGQKVHFVHDVLIDTISRRECVQFTLPADQGNYLARFVTPTHYEVDVDFSLYKGGSCTGGGQYVAGSFAYEEEAIFAELTAGTTYVFATQFYTLSGRPFPSSTDCASFQLEVAIEPVSFSTVGWTSPCTERKPPATVPFGTISAGSYQRSLANWKTWSATTSFTVPMPQTDGEVAAVIIDVWYQFTAGAVFMELAGVALEPGMPDGIPIRRVSRIGVNHAYLATYLPAGTYTITLTDASTSSDTSTTRPGRLQCAAYELSVRTYSAIAPPDFCDQTYRLPTDLRAQSSAPFGGPQNADGSVVIAGDEFYLDPNPQRAHNYILFSLPQKSFVRPWYRVDSTQGSYDIDIALYDNVNASSPTRCCSPALWLLNAKSTPYMLDVVFMDITSTDQCGTFAFEFAIQPEATVISDAACPATVPAASERLPPSNIVLPSGSFVSFFNPDGYFYFIPTEYSSTMRKFQSITSLNVQSNATLMIYIAYNFLAYDFTLQLQDNTGNTVANGYNSPHDVTQYNNFFSLIYTNVNPGIYKIVLTETLKTSINRGDYCHYFDFFVLGTTTGSAAPTVVTGVSPSSGSNLNPTKNLTLTITLSQQLSITSTQRQNFLSWLLNLKSVALSTARPATYDILPSYAYIDLLRTTITVTFPATSLQAGASYRLYLNTTGWASSTVAFQAYRGVNTYRMFKCDTCNDHGTCNYDAQRCDCVSPWSGRTCNACASGYHGSGGTCVPNTFCTASSCSGHGNCTDLAGYPSCTCYSGYVDADGGFCNGCAVGWVMTGGVCEESTDPFDEGFLCDSQLVPSSLNTPAYLGSGNTVHLQGEFYIDPRGTSHSTTFSLADLSVMRLYIEPHWVDIDVYVWRVDPAGESLLSYNIGFNNEETVFMQLNPGSYRVQFNYYFWDDARNADCETFNMEWAITSVSHASRSGSMINSQCAAATQLPAIPPTTISAPFNQTYRTYTLRSPQRRAGTAYNFWNWTFTVAPVPNKQAVLTAILGYRFLLGDLALVLIEGTDLPSSCNPWADSGYTVCQQGSNLFNSDQLRALLLPGTYSLYLYEPTPLLFSNCSLYDFDISVTYEDPTDDLFLCPARRLPATFNAPGYFDSTGSFLHIQDTFLVDESNMVAFNVTKTSWLRVHIEFPGRRLSIRIHDETRNTFLPTFLGSTESEALYSIQPGAYHLIVMGTVDTSCPSFNLELTIDDTPPYPACPSGNILPDLGTITLPFNRTIGRVPVTYYSLVEQQGAAVAEWGFHVDETVLFESAVSSDFLLSALRVSVVSSATGVTVSGSYDYNSHRLVTTLAAGDYTLRITRPQTAVNPAVLCDSFNFELFIDALNSVDACRQTGEALPPSFNTPRWLGYDRTVNFFGTIRVPPRTSTTWSFSTAQKTFFTVDTDSLLRVYVEPYKGIDVDIFLWNEDTRLILASGISFYGEENIVYRLSRGTNYSLAVAYWGRAQVTCPQFNLEIGLAPFPAVSACPGGATTWPSFPLSSLANLPISFSQNSYYFDQFAATPASKTWKFTVIEPVSFFLELTYDFTLGPLVATLTNSQSSQTTYTSAGLDRAVLVQVSLLPGTYELKIYSPTTNQFTQSLGCAYYGVTLLIDKRVDTNADLSPPLPASLDTLSYLGPPTLPNPVVHFGAVYNVQNKQTRFTLIQPTFLRIRAKPDRTFLQTTPDAIRLTLAGPTGLSGNLEIIGLASPGDYVFSYVIDAATDPVFDLFLEFELEWYNILTSVVSTLPKSCTSSPPLQIATQNGYFHLFDSNRVIDSMTYAGTNLVFDSASFNLDRNSIIYAEIGYEFLTSELNLLLVNAVDNTFITGKKYVNSHVIYTSVPPGDWRLVISQDTPFPTGFTETLSLCRYYSLSMVIRDADDGEDHSNCVAHRILPVYLNSDTNFGGPMNSIGELAFFGNDFLIFSSTTTTAFSVSQSSVVSVYIKSNTYSSGTSGGITRVGGSTISPLRVTSENWNDVTLSTFQVDTGSYTLQLTHTSYYEAACDTYTLQVVIQPVVKLQNDMACSITKPSQLPFAGVTGATSSDFKISAVSGRDLAQYTAGNHLDYWVPLSFTRRGTLLATIAFNQLVTPFQLQLVQNTWNVPTWGRLGPLETEQSGLTMSNNLARTVSTGNYSLHILAETFAVSGLDYASLCYPYTLCYEIVPSGMPYLADVVPNGGNEFNPDRDLRILIEFSERFYFGTARLASNESSLVQQLFRLQASTGAYIQAATVTTSDGYNWAFTFSAASLAPAETYKLSVTSGIKDSGGNPLFSSACWQGLTYRMLNTLCNSHGTFEATLKECICEVGYGGLECETCAPGYKDIAPGTYLNCRPQDYQACSPNPCNLNECQTDTITGEPVCICEEKFSGTHCELCRTGYHGWPACDKDQSCPACIHGACNVTTGQCVCPSNWAGVDCSECADGFSGDNCTADSTGSTVLIVVLFLVGFGLLGFVGVYLFRKRRGSKIYNMLPVFKFGNTKKEDKKYQELMGMQATDLDDMQL